ncbi:hypothetical protein BG006_011302 [Podila minutissima]|uniref:RRM domain-containing protein n=1 Tax=Podila minutissima TaxID=64525 RepID=A0A9P5SSH9_9FUNG|nr:hypothetical protein BG006_011302 [Podila minutissima]
MSDYDPEYEYDPNGDTGSGAAVPATGAAEVAGAPAHTSAMPSEPQYIEETGRWTFTDAEGVSFEYDENLKAWFPMYNEQLLQAQQSAYGETIPDSLESVYAENARRQKRKKHEVEYTGSGHASPSSAHPDGDVHDETMTSAERAYEEAGLEMIPGRGEGSKNNNNNNKRAKGNNHKERKPKPISSVFVTGLPLDTDIEEMGEFFKKGGVFMEDDGGNPRIKLYTNQEGRRTGEGLVTYLRPESVALAIDLLDDTEYRPSVEKGRVRVQQAQFKEKEKPASAAGTAGSSASGNGGMSEERKKKVQKKYQKLEKKLDWFEDDENLVKADKWNKVCILKHMFTIAELEADPTLLLDLKEDIREECEKVGEVTNVIIYDQHPEGVVSVRFKDKESALLCVKLMNGRFFAGQRVEAGIYDGHTKYENTKSKEQIEEEEKQRLDRYAKWLESEEEREKAAKKQQEITTAGQKDEDDEQTIAADAPTP